MDDLISRQAAIDEIVNTVSSIGRYDNTAVGYGATLRQNEIIGIIEKLPSAQPEQRWIPVTERLPEECGEYLVTKKEIGWSCEEYYSNGIAYFDTSFHEANEVVAWMPLLEPYRGMRYGRFNQQTGGD